VSTKPGQLQAHRYGELRRGGGILPPNSDRAAALRAVASLTGWLHVHERNVGALHGAKLDARELAARIALRPQSLTRGIHDAKAFETAAVLVSRSPLQIAGGQTLRKLTPSLATVHRELLRVQSVIRAYRHAAQSAQDSIEVAVRGIGRLGVNSALLLLPPKVSVPLGIAVRAVERVVSRGIDLGIDR
jgi:hypothetical protein